MFFVVVVFAWVHTVPTKSICTDKPQYIVGIAVTTVHPCTEGVFSI